MTVTKADLSVAQRLIDLGLGGYEAKVLVALAGLGEADTKELAATSGVPRTSVYACLDRLVDLGVVERVVGVDVLRWRFRSWLTVVDALTGAARGRFEADLEQLGALTKAMPR